MLDILEKMWLSSKPTKKSPRSHQNCQYLTMDMTLVPRLIFNPKTRISVQEAPFGILLFMFCALDSLGVPYVSLAKTRKALAHPLLADIRDKNLETTSPELVV